MKPSSGQSQSTSLMGGLVFNRTVEVCKPTEGYTCGNCALCLLEGQIVASEALLEAASGNKLPAGFRAIVERQVEQAKARLAEMRNAL